MQKKLVKKSNFAKMAGVNASTVTRISKTILKEAVEGKYIDAGHPAAIEYLENKELAQTNSTHDGVDPLYEKAVLICNQESCYKKSFIQRNLHIGYKRACKILNMMHDNELVPQSKEPLKTRKPAKSPVEKPRGQAAVKEAKKQQIMPEKIEGTMDIPKDIQEFADYTLRNLIERFGTDTRFVDWLTAIQKIEAINEKRLKNAETEGKLISRRLVLAGVIDPINSAHLKMLKDGSKTIAAGAISKHSAGAELSEIETYVTEIMSSLIKPVKNKITRALKNA
jgi:hypothetical protein